jgi:predicted O-linked N-acetylglucosamine transferase (SPINDLY family)
MDESLYSEKTVRLRSYWCYEPVPVAPEVARGPFNLAGQVTFGCLNNFGKISPPALRTWQGILSQTPESRMILHAGEGSHRQRMLSEFAREGIEPARIDFYPRLPVDQYLRLYDRIDIALDPFPYGGGTTTCDALWMGVPVVTLRGQTAVSRGGASILSNIGLPELIAETLEDYVRIANGLARDPHRASALRAGMRARMRTSPLMDAAAFAKGVESAYRDMWERWCVGGV